MTGIRYFLKSEDIVWVCGEAIAAKPVNPRNEKKESIMRLKRIEGFLCFLTILTASITAEDYTTIDDFKGGTNANYIGGFWYYYDDNGGTKEDDRPLSAPESLQSTIDVPFTMKPRHASGNLNDTFQLRDYAFAVKADADSNNYATMPFTLGSSWHAIKGDYQAYPFLGLGAQVAKEGEYSDLSCATGITFRLRSHVFPLNIAFKIETMDITRDSTFAFFQKLIPSTLPNIWSDYAVTIPLDLTTPDWYTGTPYNFTASQICKLSWEIHGKANSAMEKGMSDTLDIDDVIIYGCTIGVRNRMILHAEKSGFRANYLRNGTVRVLWNCAPGIENGTINLVNTKGVVVKSDHVTSAGGLSTDISVQRIPAGLYVVWMSGADAAGKKITQRSWATIVK